MKKVKNYRPAPRPKTSSEVHMVNLSTYTSPKIKEVKNKDWISYGEDNNYYQFFKIRLFFSGT